MYLVRVTPPMNLTFSDDSLFLKNTLGGGHKFFDLLVIVEFKIYYETKHQTKKVQIVLRSYSSYHQARNIE